QARPSPDLLDTIYQCQDRQNWYRDYQRTNHEAPVDFVGTLTTATLVTEAAARIRETLGISIAQRQAIGTWEDALRHLIRQAEDAGVLVMISGIVGSNTHRTLDVNEFRGFALVDAMAPLVFVNGTDSKSAQMFTLVHELAHIWLGQSAVSDMT